MNELLETTRQPAVADKWQEVLAYQFPDLEQRMLARSYFASGDDYHAAFVELKKYLWLRAEQGLDYPILCTTLDYFWHEFILFTRDYHEFCERYFGQFIHHRPLRPPTTPAVKALGMEFFRAYKATFGPIPRLWLDSDLSSAGRPAFDQ